MLGRRFPPLGLAVFPHGYSGDAQARKSSSHLCQWLDDTKIIPLHLPWPGVSPRAWRAGGYGAEIKRLRGAGNPPSSVPLAPSAGTLPRCRFPYFFL